MQQSLWHRGKGCGITFPKMFKRYRYFSRQESPGKRPAGEQKGLMKRLGREIADLKKFIPRSGLYEQHKSGHHDAV